MNFSLIKLLSTWNFLKINSRTRLSSIESQPKKVVVVVVVVVVVAVVFVVLIIVGQKT